MKFKRTTKPLKDFIVAFITLGLILVLILLLNQKSRQKVIEARIVSTTNKFDIDSFSYDNIKIILTLKNKKEVTISLSEDMLVAPLVLQREFAYKTLQIELYGQSLSFDCLFYFTPTSDDLYEKDGITYLNYGIYPQNLDKENKHHIRAKAQYRNIAEYTFKNGELIFNEVFSDQNVFYDSWSLEQTSANSYDVYYYFAQTSLSWRKIKQENNHYTFIADEIIDYNKDLKEIASLLLIDEVRLPTLAELTTPPFNDNAFLQAGILTYEKDHQRTALISDYARLVCLEMNEGRGKYWSDTPLITSPEHDYSSWQYYVDYDGAIAGSPLEMEKGIRPVIELVL